MRCSKCLNNNEKDSIFCIYCGNKLKKINEKHPSTSIVFGVISTICIFLESFNIVGIVLGIIGIVHGAKCRKISKTPLAFSIVGLGGCVIRLLNTLFILLLICGYYLLYFLIIILVVFLMPETGVSLPGSFFMWSDINLIVAKRKKI